MTEQYLYHAVNSFLVYCCLAYILCFATFHLVRSINYHVGNDGTFVLSLIVSLLIVYTVLQ